MNLRYDLHTHSTASDGTLTPPELVDFAHQQGVDVLALTDHDVTKGLAEATQAASLQSMTLISGVEISVSWRHQTIHILGLNIDAEDTSLLTGLEKLRAFRVWRAEEIGRRLEKAGIGGAFEVALTMSNGKNISRTHFARFLAQAGYARDVRQVFKRYLVRGKPGYVPGQWAELAEVIGWIHAAGGIAVIAHPARYKISATRLRELIEQFKKEGGQAIEVVSGTHSRDECERIAQLARHYDLLASRGSDFHDPAVAYIKMASLADLPENLTPVWVGW